MTWAGIRAENPIGMNEICSEVSARHVARVAFDGDISRSIKTFGFDRIAPDDLYFILTQLFKCPVVLKKAKGDVIFEEVPSDRISDKKNHENIH
jgi:hypothetical protein